MTKTAFNGCCQTPQTDRRSNKLIFCCTIAVDGTAPQELLTRCYTRVQQLNYPLVKDLPSPAANPWATHRLARLSRVTTSYESGVNCRPQDPVTQDKTG